MIISIVSSISVFKGFSQIKKVIERERSSVAFVQIFSWLIYLLEGKLSAYFVGWRKAYLGRGSRIIGTRYINAGIKLSVGRYAWIEAILEHGEDQFKPEILLGDRFNASERLHISAVNRIEIGNDCLFGSSVYISDHNHGSYKNERQSNPYQTPLTRRLISHGPVVIGSNVWIGDNVTIIGPVKIGKGVVVGANSVITSDLEDHVLAGGVPAKVLKRFNFSSEKWEAI